MTFQPVLPFGGYSGWRFLQSSLETQQTQFAQSPVQDRDRDYFRENIGTVTSAEDLVSDYRLLRVALGAYGLQDDLPNRAFIEKVLSDGVGSDDALSNRLADKRYRAFSEAFGFGGVLPPNTQSPTFADRVLSRFDRQSFEVSVGEIDGDMRLALTASREVPEIVAAGGSDTTAWLSVMGNPPLRQVFETAFGLPSAIATIDIDKQVEAFREGAERTLGFADFSQFSDPEAVNELLKSFTIRAQVNAGISFTTPGATAITLLQNLA
ncbi:DUF1217 domain-containing protein [Gymnodinialimonas hymeniacidonis]|uniref:DUF1217 domain-containing protein n=1 Tax=Gymnodinialimonas hymeniacidonis TaxID=3126508 RepID=UPI0034C6672B